MFQTPKSTAGSRHALSDFRIQDTHLVGLHQPRMYAFGGSIQMYDLLSTLVIVHRCCLSRLQALLTLSHKYFSLFNRSTCALSVPYRYSGLRGIHLASSSCSQKQLYSWKNSTQEKTHRATRLAHWKGCHLCCVPFQISLTNLVSREPFVVIKHSRPYSANQGWVASYDDLLLGWPQDETSSIAFTKVIAVAFFSSS